MFFGHLIMAESSSCRFFPPPPLLPVTVYPTLGVAAVNQPFSQSFYNANALSYSAVNLPPGLTMNAVNGVVSGAPTAVGSYDVQLTITTPSGPGLMMGTFVVVQPAAPVLTNAASASAYVGRPFLFQVAAQNYPSNYSYAATGLPSGFTINPTNGMISGMSTSTGTFSVTLSATTSYGTGTAPLTLNLQPLTPGYVVAWGWNGSGQTTVPAGVRATAIAAGYAHTLALKSDGTVVAWGAGARGGVAPYAYGQCDVPAGLSNVTAIAAGNVHSLALKNDGTVVAWGYNDYGQATVPAGLSGVVAIAAGFGHSMVLKQDGTLVAWGDNQYGQLGVPANLTGVTAIAAGYRHSLALKSDGTVVEWGQYNPSITTMPTDLTNVTAIAALSFFSMALRRDGTVALWGAINPGDVNGPAGLNMVTGIAAGELHALALKGDGTVFGWGNNDHGQISVPTVLRGATAVAAGTYHSLALVPNVPAPVILTPPASQSVAMGSNAVFTVVAAGLTQLNYQWRFNGAPLPQATNATLSLTAVQPVTSEGAYDVVVSDSYGTNVSAVAQLTVFVPPQLIVPAPVNVTNFVGDIVQFGVTATSPSPMSFQWFQGNTPVPGATSALLSLTNVQLAQAGSYQVVIANSSATVTSAPPTTLTIIGSTNGFIGPAAGLADRFYADGFVRVDSSGSDGGYTTFWGYTSATQYNSATRGTLTFHGTNITGNQLTVVTDVYSLGGSLPPAAPYEGGFFGPGQLLNAGSLSRTTTVTTLTPPTITVPPQPASFTTGGNATFSVTATGFGQLFYQWRFNGTNLAGATNATLTLANLAAVNAGAYTVLVSNFIGTNTSAVANLDYFGDLKLYAGTIVAGTIGRQFRVDYADVVNVGTTNWQVLTNITLPSSPYVVIDYSSPGQTKRFYRAVAVP